VRLGDAQVYATEVALVDAICDALRDRRDLSAAKFIVKQAVTRRQSYQRLLQNRERMRERAQDRAQRRDDRMREHAQRREGPRPGNRPAAGGSRAGTLWRDLPVAGGLTRVSCFAADACVGQTGPTSDGVLRIVTDLPDVPPHIIAFLYVYRWTTSSSGSCPKTHVTSRPGVSSDVTPDGPSIEKQPPAPAAVRFAMIGRR
jgi:hypothetical protein